MGIEILSDLKLITEGEKVGASESALLSMLKIRPFHYGLVCANVYDEGSVYHPSVLDIKPDDLIQRFLSGVTNIAAVSLAIGYPTVASVPHSIVNGFKNVAAVCLSADIDIPEIASIKEYLADPSKFVCEVAAPVADEPASGGAEAKEEKKAESEEEDSDDDMGFGL